MDDLDQMEEGGQDEVGSLVHNSDLLKDNCEGEGAEGSQGAANNGEPGCKIPRIVIREDESIRKAFCKVVDIFGDKQEKSPSIADLINGIGTDNRPSALDNSDNIMLGQVEQDMTKNKINLLKLNSVIRRLENPINPLSVMNENKRTITVREGVVNLDVELDGYWNEDEFLELHRKENPRLTEKKILNYVQKIADAKKLFMWPPPWFSLILTTVHLILFLETHYDQMGAGQEMIEVLEFDT